MQPESANVATQKSEQRRHFSSARQAMTEQQRESANAAILAHLDHLLRSTQAQRVAAYVPDAVEPGGKDLVPFLASRCQQLWLPCCLPKGVLQWGQYQGDSTLLPGRYNIPEPPQPHHSSAILEDLDLIIVPALAASAQGIRLGKGASFYDRALTGITTASALLLFGHEYPVDIATEAHDAGCDWTITPDKLWPNEC
ncbi:5-formyltetrahydrofolate cyclo-ligase [Corynebacterium pelargi]|uniref:5-formyltetrahydrofolate cyclo-ligase n=1 Tax=Corynebacterium pelargi TaxID=1471400 RepID=A0A410W9Z5_9CORY|nr:5-formyltetrahydrofolate cyclo-ligase [Corynebacterium pelargi]QAU52772.1 5-formyltetrahydrofolate cyclo-ligase family protein [Corynebacterium pelargi]GGG78667.1 5-formyltetrahydrofolate cyclo-ligase [Corynebacterium pelargi]